MPRVSSGLTMSEGLGQISPAGPDPGARQTESSASVRVNSPTAQLEPCLLLLSGLVPPFYNRVGARAYLAAGLGTQSTQFLARVLSAGKQKQSLSSWKAAVGPQHLPGPLHPVVRCLEPRGGRVQIFLEQQQRPAPFRGPVMDSVWPP